MAIKYKHRCRCGSQKTVASCSAALRLELRMNVYRGWGLEIQVHLKRVRPRDTFVEQTPLQLIMHARTDIEVGATAVATSPSPSPYPIPSTFPISFIIAFPLAYVKKKVDAALGLELPIAFIIGISNT